ncbi:hypothetical protein DSECCO2_587700 [anaerobic digester metagenome]
MACRCGLKFKGRSMAEQSSRKQFTQYGKQISPDDYFGAVGKIGRINPGRNISYFSGLFQPGNLFA